MAEHVSQILYELQGDKKIEEVKEEDWNWMTSAYVEDNDEDQFMSEDEASFEEYDAFEE